MQALRLVFRRAAPVKSIGTNRDEGIAKLLGKLKGRVRFAPGFDATQPPDPALVPYLDEKYGPQASWQDGGVLKP